MSVFHVIEFFRLCQDKHSTVGFLLREICLRSWWSVLLVPNIVVLAVYSFPSVPCLRQKTGTAYFAIPVFYGSILITHDCFDCCFGIGFWE